MVIHNILIYIPTFTLNEVGIFCINNNEAYMENRWHSDQENNNL